jgi:hypothetical protein
MLVTGAAGQVRHRGKDRTAEVVTMIDPMLIYKLTHSSPTSELLNQLVRFHPELTIEAALPLLAARMLGATASDEDDDQPSEPELATA